MENVVGPYLLSMFKGLGRFCLKSLQSIGFIFLATVGMWPAAAYLCYVAMVS